jgi:hypothetical protein
VTIPSLPPRNETVEVHLEHPYLVSSIVTFKGPANGHNITASIMVRLSDAAPNDLKTFQAGVVVTGTFASVYPAQEGSITVRVVAPPTPSSGLSTGSVFLILYEDTPFLLP